MIILGSDYIKIVVPFINNAKTNIDILMYHWTYYSYASKTNVQSLNLAIKSAITRGVPVRVILHCGSPSDNLQHKNAEMANYLKTWGAQVKFYKRGGTLHSKLLLIDKTIAVCGSHNYSQKSMSSNVETSVLIQGSGEIRRFIEYFNILWGQC